MISIGAHVHIGNTPPDSLGLIWLNPETGKSALGINGPHGSSLWVSMEENVSSVSASVDSYGYFSTHMQITQERGILVRYVRGVSTCPRNPWMCSIPVYKSILDVEETVSIRHWINKATTTLCMAEIVFREILAMLPNKQRTGR